MKLREWQWIAMLLVVVALGAFLAGCANLSNTIGAGYVSVETLAEAITEECGINVVGDNCRDDSLLDKADVNAMRDDLKRAKGLLDEANQWLDLGDIAAAQERLQAARTILNVIKYTLRERGVQ